MDFEKQILNLLKRITKQDLKLEIPPNPEFGDYALPCFQLSKKLKKAPQEIAQQLKSKIKPPKFLQSIEAKGPYLNFFINKTESAKNTIQSILKQKNKYGSATNKEKIMVEFSGPNPFKSFHIGHLRNTVLGESLVRILKHQGYKIIPVNYFNDTGTHVSKSIWGLEHLKLKPKGNRGEWLGELYAIANEKIGTNPSKLEQVQEIHKKIEEKNPHYINLLKKGVKDSTNYFNQIYKDLDVKFNKIYFDSTYIQKGKTIVSQLLRKKIAKKSEDAILVNLEEYKLHKVLILKKDETALYITKDLAMVIDRIKQYKLDRLIYVAGSEQKLHFKQLFKILELYGFKQAKKCHHLSYELVMLPEGRMASRRGRIVNYSDLKNELLSKISKEVNKRHKTWTSTRKQKAVNAILSSAIKFDFLKQGPEKVITYSPDKALELEGDTGPYVQYTHARISSILRREKPKGKVKFEALNTQEETNLITKLSGFPNVIKKSATEYKPYLIANYLLELSRLFNEFYHKHKVLKASKDLKNARLSLITVIKQVFSLGLNLLAIQAPEEM